MELHVLISERLMKDQLMQVLLYLPLQIPWSANFKTKFQTSKHGLWNLLQKKDCLQTLVEHGISMHFKDFLHFQQEIMDKYIQIHQLLHGNWFSIFLRIAGSPPTGFLGCSPRHQWSSGIFWGACTIPMLNILEAQDAKTKQKNILARRSCS